MQLSIVSYLPESYGRTLRPYRVDGIDTVGVKGQEPYAIDFRNSSGDPVQVVLAVDGRNVLTGQQAVLDPSRDNFVVRGGDSLRLEAWPETYEHGARFVFTQAADSVAHHTTGDLGAVGYISIAVYEEGDPSPAYRSFAPETLGGYGNEATLGMPTRGGGMRSAVGTGAGETISQRIGKARGLRQPRLREPILQVRYLWWDELQRRLRNLRVPVPMDHPTGFAPSRLANLGDTPRRVPDVQTIPVAGGEYPRVI